MQTQTAVTDDAIQNFGQEEDKQSLFDYDPYQYDRLAIHTLSLNSVQMTEMKKILLTFNGKMMIAAACSPANSVWVFAICDTLANEAAESLNCMPEDIYPLLLSIQLDGYLFCSPVCVYQSLRSKLDALLTICPDFIEISKNMMIITNTAKTIPEFKREAMRLYADTMLSSAPRESILGA